MKYVLLLSFSLFAAAPPNEAAADFALERWDAFRARFSPQLQKLISVDKLKQLHAFGRCQAPKDPPTATNPRPDLTAYIYSLECEKQVVGLSITVDTAGLIQGLFYVEPPTGLAVVTGQYILPAKITVPSGSGPFPAVVFVHGSGPHDMDETIGPNKPFRDLANGLAARGIASIRYTKRTRQYRPVTITLDQETIQDALSAAATLRKDPRIDPKRIFIVGHSLGAFAAPRIGKADPSLAGLILLAGNTRPIGVLITEQVKYLDGEQSQAAEMLTRLPPPYVAELTADPVPIAQSLKMPMLILQGERDYQVTMADFKGWQKLKDPRVTLKSYPGLNHLFQPGKGKSYPQEYQQEIPFSSTVINDIAAWIKR